MWTYTHKSIQKQAFDKGRRGTLGGTGAANASYGSYTIPSGYTISQSGSVQSVINATAGLTLASGSMSLPFNVAPGTGGVDLLVSSPISMVSGLGVTNAGITKSGSGTLELSGNNSYNGATAINAGVLNIRSANALGTSGPGASVAAGAALQIQGGITTSSQPLTLNGTGISSDGALRNISGTNSYAGLVTLGSRCGSIPTAAR